HCFSRSRQQHTARKNPSAKKSKRFFPRPHLLHTKGKRPRPQKKNRRRLRQLHREKRNPFLHRLAHLRLRNQKGNRRQRRNLVKHHRQRLSLAKRHRQRLLFHQPQRQRLKKESAARQTRLCHRKRSVVSRIIR